MLSVASNVSTVAMIPGLSEDGASASSPAVFTSAIIGQSRHVVGWINNTNFYTANGIMPDVVAGVDVQIGIPAIYARTGEIQLLEVTQARADGQSVSPGAVGLANVWHLGSGGAPLRLTGLAKAGQSMATMMQSGEAPDFIDTDGRLWADEVALVSATEAAWGPIQRVAYMWGGGEGPVALSLWDDRAPHFFGINPDGTPYDFDAPGAIEHCLVDTTGRGYGLLSAEVKVDLEAPCPTTFGLIALENTDPPNINYATDAAGLEIGSTRSGTMPTRFIVREEVLARSPEPNRGKLLVALNMSLTGDHEEDPLNPGTGKQMSNPAESLSHPALKSPYGQVLFGQHTGFSMLVSHGFAETSHLDRVEMEETGLYADFILRIPATATLRTPREVYGLTVPTPRPQQQPVVGVTIRRNGDTARTEQPLWLPTSELTAHGYDLAAYPAAYRGTAVIHDSGTDVAGGREAVIRVTPEVPFENGNTINFATDKSSASAVLAGWVDHDAKLWLDFPCAHEARLDDGTAHRYPGPAPHMTIAYPVAGLAGGNPAPTPPVIARGTQTAGLDGPAIGNGVEAITMVFEGFVGAQSGFGQKSFLRVRGDQLELKIDGRSSARAATISMGNSAGTLLTSDYLGSNSVPAEGVACRILMTASQNDGAGNWRLAYYLNDALLGSELSGPISGTGLFNNVRDYLLLGSNIGAGVGRVAIWSGAHAEVYSTDGSLPSGAPAHLLEGDAAYWNGAGLPQGWSKTGSGLWSDL